MCFVLSSRWVQPLLLDSSFGLLVPPKSQLVYPPTPRFVRNIATSSLAFFSEGGAGTFNQLVVLANFRIQNIICFSDCRPVNVAVCFVSEAPNLVG